MGSPLRVVIVDDHVVFRRTGRRVLEDAGFEVVGEAADAAGALRLAAELSPDVVLLDVHLPDADGFRLAERLTGCPASPAVVLVSSHDRSDYGGLIAGSSARGFLTKADLDGPSLHHLLAPPDDGRPAHDRRY